jgi:tRNA modification GTPase
VADSFRGSGEDLIVRWLDDQTVEIHCHGGFAAGQTIMDSLRQCGYLPITQREFVHLSGENPWRAEVQLAIAEAPTVRTSKVLLRQYTLQPTAIQQICHHITSEETAAAIETIQRMLEFSWFGMHLTMAWTVVLCGRTNVGKCSLMNRLLGYQRAIVHSSPGTTRDVLQQRTAFDGWPVEIKDTAGLRPTTDPLETEGIVRAQEQIRQADVAVAVYDASTAWTHDDTLLFEQLKPHLVVHNKCDLPAADAQINRPAGLAVSALTGAGIEQLMDAIGRALVPRLPPADQAIPISREQVDCLKDGLQMLERGDECRALAILQQMTRLDLQVLTDQP